MELVEWISGRIIENSDDKGHITEVLPSTNGMSKISGTGHPV